VLGRIWYLALTDHLRPEADFADFVQATIDIAGEPFGMGGKVQRNVAEAWSDVGLFVLHVGCATQHIPIKKPRQRPRCHRRTDASIAPPADALTASLTSTIT
jgi:hypothetical protein